MTRTRYCRKCKIIPEDSFYCIECNLPFHLYHIHNNNKAPKGDLRSLTCYICSSKSSSHESIPEELNNSLDDINTTTHQADLLSLETGKRTCSKSTSPLKEKTIDSGNPTVKKITPAIKKMDKKTIEEITKKKCNEGFVNKSVF